MLDEVSEQLRVFLSYRRSDCQAQANGLNDGLRHRLPEAHIFMDLDSIPFGVDFEHHIRQEIAACDVVLVLVGDNWLDPSDDTGRRRIDDPSDFVRLEIEHALMSAKTQVIPVLVENAVMPSPAELPKSIGRLARLNAIELSDRRWQSDMQRLTKAIQDIASEPRRPVEAPSPHTVRLDQIQGQVIASAVGAFSGEFNTKDVSEHPAVVEAHAALVGARNYHAMVGTYLSRMSDSLGLRSLGRSRNGRGERWDGRVPRAALPREGVTAVSGPPRAQLSPSHSYPPPVLARRPSIGRQMLRAFMIVLPVVTLGVLAWVPPLWAGVKNSGVKQASRRLYLLAILTGMSAVLGFALFAMAPTNSEGTASGPLPVVGFLLLVGAMCVGTVVAVRERNVGIVTGGHPRISVSTAEVALTSQQVRAQYRALIARDPALARSMQVGRPDQPRPYDDGGLLDVNRLPEHALLQHAGLGPGAARRVVEARERYNGLSDIDQVVAYANIDATTAERLREYAVFL